MTRDFVTCFGLLLTFASLASQQTVFDCPLGWDTFNSECYHFVYYPTHLYSEAIIACEMDGASLISINTIQEHTFVSEWLTRHDLDRSHRWWTSGIGEGPSLSWEGDGTTSLLDQAGLWGEEGVDVMGNLHVVYKFTTLTNKFMWSRQYDNESSPYICEISLRESFRIYQAARDHTYGTDSTDPQTVPRGPRFTIRPKSVVVVGTAESAFVECDADGVPAPTYKWYLKSQTGGDVEVKTHMDNRYSLINGRFVFQNPRPQDAGDYYCEATNKFGTIISHTVRVSFGFLGEFSNDPPGAVRALQYQGTVIYCNPPRYNPRISITWFKGPGPNFLRTDLNTYQFISLNNNLYFSETALLDAGFYHCSVTLYAPLGQAIATTQPPSVASMGTELIIKGDTAIDFGPTIHNDFPAVYPTPALRGEELRLECLAYGRLPLYYSWTRENGPMPAKAYMLDINRVLVIPNAQLEDAGNYTCHVERSNMASDKKTFSLRIEALPYFIFPLRDQHVDINTQATLRCEAMAIPLPRYAWFKNGLPLIPVPDDIEVTKNVVVIKSANPERHNGMYQCSATNIYGTRLSSAQVRVLSFAPNFHKRPVQSSQMASVGGNATIICQPEAAPRPEITWYKNGVLLAADSAPGGRVIELGNSNLLITQAQMSDQGEYKCVAINNKGNASSSGLLDIVTATVLSVRPSDTRVELNGSAFLACEASYDQIHHDIAYVWTFNGHPLDLSFDAHYKKYTREGHPGLYVINAQFYSDGVYECEAMTPSDTVKASAHLTVVGPPGEPAGVHGSVDFKTITLSWFAGADHGSSVHSYHVEYMTNFNPDWRVQATGLKTSDLVDELYPDKRTTVLTHLKPGSSYSFRVRAVNSYGVGEPSIPSTFLRIPDAPPTVAPDNIRETFSTVGTLAFAWDSLDPEDLTGSGTGYKVYWRIRDEDNQNAMWSSDVVMSQDELKIHIFFTTVGYNFYYLPYEVKVAAFNDLGHSPNSSIKIVMSAEDLPPTTPKNTKGYEFNATAMYVFWEPIPNNRLYARGNIIGYQVNFWWDKEPGTIMSHNHYCPDCGKTVVIGLRPGEAYWVNIQVFNTAGLGPKGEEYFIKLPLNAPQLYPEYVSVSSHGSDSVFVSWRGVIIGRKEEALQGFKFRFWPSTEPYVTANETVLYGRNTWGILTGIQPGIVYGLRVLAFNRGGDGKKSPTTYFTLEGQVAYNPTTTEIFATGSHVAASLLVLIMTISWYIVFVT